jgi:hypothetical protein
MVRDVGTHDIYIRLFFFVFVFVLVFFIYVRIGINVGTSFNIKGAPQTRNGGPRTMLSLWSIGSLVERMSSLINVGTRWRLSRNGTGRIRRSQISPSSTSYFLAGSNDGRIQGKKKTNKQTKKKIYILTFSLYIYIYFL